MTISIKLLGSNIEINKKIQKALSEELNKNLQKGLKKAELQIKSLVPGWIKEQPEVSSILEEGVFGSLNAQLGFVQGTATQAVDIIALAVAETVTVKFEKIKSNLSGDIIFYLQPNNFFNVLSLPEAIIPALSGPLPWLYWLLTQGTNTIVSGYEYEPDNSGRSGGGTMTSGKSWRIPPQYAGNINDNFITRALQNREKEMNSILETALYG